MPPFWDPICPPQGIACLQAFLEAHGHDVTIKDFNTDGPLFSLQKKYFTLGMQFFPRWRLYNIFRNGPRFFARHQLAWLYGRKNKTMYNDLVRHILNFDHSDSCTSEAIQALDAVIEEIFDRVRARARELSAQGDWDAVGCTMLETTFPSALMILREIKEARPATRTVLGGPGALMGNNLASGNLKRILARCHWVDVILHGEGELLFERFLREDSRQQQILSLDDLAKDANQPTCLIDVDQTALPSFHGLSLKAYLWLSTYSSRGCPYKCAFCSEYLFWRKYRQKNVEKIASDMQELTRRFGKNRFYLCDSLINNVVNPLAQKLAQTGGKYYWDCYLRIDKDCRNTQKVRLWAKAGMMRARIGVESGSARVLELMNKKITPIQAQQGLATLAQFGINTSTLWIAGFPGEQEEDFIQTLEFFKDNHPLIYQADVMEFVNLDGQPSPEREESAYPDEFDSLLILKYQELKDGVPPAQRYERITRFEELRHKLGVPNPYSLNELVEAQLRWVKLGHIKKEDAVLM